MVPLSSGVWAATIITRTTCSRTTVPSDGVVPGEARLAKEAGLSNWFSTVVSSECIQGVVRDV